MKKIKELVDQWEKAINKPFNIISSVEIGREDFRQVIEEIKKLQEENRILKEFVDENSVEIIEKKMEPYYEELAKLWNEEESE